MAEKPLKSFIRSLECVVCLDTYRDPRILPCPRGAHSVCRKCLGRLVRGTTVTCPLCRHQHDVPPDGVDGFIPNLMAADMIDNLCRTCRKTEPEMNCSHCGKDLCVNCRVSHVSYNEAAELLDKLCKSTEEAEAAVGNTHNPEEARVYFRQIDDAAEDIYRKLEARKRELKAAVTTVLDRKADTSRVWKHEIDTKIAEALRYIDVTKIQLGDKYDNHLTDQEIDDIKEQCEMKIATMTQSIKQVPPAHVQVLDCDTTTALSAIAEFGSVRDEKGDNVDTSMVDFDAAVLTYGRPRIVGRKGNNPGEFIFATDVAVCPVTGHIMVADTGNSRVQVLSGDTCHVTDITDREEGRKLICPACVAVSSTGDIIVSDYHADAVLVYNREGGYSHQLPGPWNQPWGIAVGTDDVTYVCDTGTNTVRVLDRAGEPITTFGGPGTGPGRLYSSPRYITLYGDNIHLSDDVGHVYVFSKSGVFIKQLDPAVIAVAKGLAVRGDKDLVIVDPRDSLMLMRGERVIGRVGVCGDKPWQLNEPGGVAVTSTGQIIVANCGSHNVLIYDPHKL